MTTKDRVIGWANPAFEKLFGYERGEMAGVSIRVGYCSDEAYQAFGREAYPVIYAGGSYRTEQECQRKDGSRFFADVSGLMLSPETGETLWCFVDVTDRKRKEQEITQLAFNDTLTALPNRRLLVDRLSQAMTANKRSDRHGAVIFIDLDNFKALNDAHGHGVGDLLLLEVADRLKGCVREIDTVSRFGGDEFVVLLGDLTTNQVHATELANKVAENIRVSLALPYVLAGGNESETIEHRCSASIGVVLFSKQHQSQEDLLKWADVAMYRSKAEGRDRVTFMAERRAKQRS